MVDRREQLAAVTEELTGLARELRTHRELLRVTMHPLEAGSGFGVIFTGATRSLGRKMRGRLVEEAKSILSLEGNVMAAVGDTGIVLYGFHEGEDTVERAIIERTARYIAFQEGYEGSIECREVPFLPTPKTQYTVPEQWDTCMVHGMNINNLVDRKRLERGNERRGLRLDQPDSREYLRIQRVPGTSVPQDRLDGYCRALLAPVIRSGEGSPERPGVHPKGLAIEFYVDAERQETLRNLDLYPAADETSMEFLLSPWETMPSNVIHRAHRALRQERGLTLTIEEAESLVNRLLDDEPRILVELRKRFLHQFGGRTAPDDAQLREMMIYISGFETLLCRLEEAAGFDFRDHLTKGIVARLGQGKPMDAARQEALVETQRLLEQALPVLTARGHSLGSEEAREGLLRTTPAEVASVVSERLERPHLIRLIVSKGVRGYVQTYSRNRTGIDVPVMQAGMKAHVGALIMSHYAPILHRHREEMRGILEAAHRSPSVRQNIPLLDELGPMGVLARSEREIIDTLLDVVLFNDLHAGGVVAAD